MLKNRRKLNIQCNNCYVGDLCLVKNLNDEIRDKINSIILEVFAAKKGTHIYGQHQKMDHLFAVYSGYCKEYWIDRHGNERIDNFYFPGDIMGLESIPNKKHLLSATAITNVKLCRIPIEPLLEIMQHSPHFLQRFIHINSNKMINNLHVKMITNARCRVANFLLNTLYRSEERNILCRQLRLPMSQIEISNFLGMAYETVSRILHDFHRLGIIKMENKEIFILDVDELKNIGNAIEEFTH